MTTITGWVLPLRHVSIEVAVMLHLKDSVSAYFSQLKLPSQREGAAPSVFFLSLPPFSIHRSKRFELKLSQLFRKNLGTGENINHNLISYGSCHASTSSLLWCQIKKQIVNHKGAVSTIQQWLSRYCCHRDKTHKQCFFPFSAQLLHLRAPEHLASTCGHEP